jgi:ABC-type amino acid transport substrate-binding protein
MRKLLLAALGAALAAPVAAQTKLDFILNWVPGGDHAPYYYAKAQGWYASEGIDLNLEPGKGSMLAAQKVGAGANPIGLADMGNVLIARSKGADLVGVFNVYANSPQGLYWKKSSGIKGIKDFPSKKIGNPAADGARPMWPALAKANGVDPKSVTWVNVDANAKLAALKAGSIDITTSFYNIHHIFKRELGEDMGFVAWRRHASSSSAARLAPSVRSGPRAEARTHTAFRPSAPSTAPMPPRPTKLGGECPCARLANGSARSPAGPIARTLHAPSSSSSARAVSAGDAPASRGRASSAALPSASTTSTPSSPSSGHRPAITSASATAASRAPSSPPTCPSA